MPGNVTAALCCLIQTFDDYASKEGDAHTLTKNELKQILSNEFAGFLGNVDDREKLDSLFNDIDENKDDTVDFREFMIAFSSVGELFHDILTGHQ